VTIAGSEIHTRTAADWAELAAESPASRQAGIPFLHVTFGTPGAQVLPASTTSRQVADALHTDYSRAGRDPR
jgi:hypothetical protein